jgi:hypothetical protein
LFARKTLALNAGICIVLLWPDPPRIPSICSPAVSPKSSKAAPSGRAARASRGPSKLAGRKLDMRCRYPGCRNKSKGPRFRFLCEEHLKLPKAEQNAALAKWADKK